MPTTSDITQPFVRFVINECYDPWKSERSFLDVIWHKSYDQFLGNYENSWLDHWRKIEGQQWRCKIFMRAARMKVIAAAGQINDVQFAGGTLPFNISPTPIPSTNGFPMDPKEAEHRAELMEKRLRDDLTESKYKNVLMSSNVELPLYGMSWHKSPVVRTIEKHGYKQMLPAMPVDMNLPPEVLQRLISQHGRFQPVMNRMDMPQVAHPSVWDMFWDPEAKAHDEGRGKIQRIMMSPSMLRELVKRPGFDKAAIKSILDLYGDEDIGAEGGYDESQGPQAERLAKRNRGITVIEYWGRCSKAYLKGTDLEGYKRDDGREPNVFAVVAFTPGLKTEIIRQPIPNPLPFGVDPFNLSVWEHIPHEVRGVGIPENVQDSTMMLNGAVRMFYDNKALSGNVLMAGRSDALAPGQDRSIFPGRYWELGKGVTKVGDALQFFTPPDVGGGMLDMINFAQRILDEESGVPRLTQGETSRHDPKTAFAFSELVQAASKGIAQNIENIDVGHIGPDLRNLYHYHMWTNPDESIKGDMQVTASGVARFQKSIRAQRLQNFLMFMLSSQILSLMVKPAKISEALAKDLDLDPDEVLYSEDELAQRTQQFAGLLGPAQAETPLQGDVAA